MAFRKPKDYDSIKIGERKVLPAGGYVCRILKAEETTSQKGRPMLKVAFDICEGDFTGYFMEQYQGIKNASDDPQSVKWPFSGTKWILFTDNEGATNRDFKSFCTALEDSGTEVWVKDVLNTEAMKNAEVGIIFRREEHEYNNLRSWRTVPWGFRSVETILSGGFNVPEDKSLAPKAIDPLVDNFQAAEDDIPF